MHKIAELIIKNRWAAIALVSVCGILSIRLLPSSYVTPVPYIGAAAIALIVLRKNVMNATIVLLASVGLSIMAAQVMEAKPGFHFSLVLLLWLPVLVCAWVLRVTRSQGAMVLVAGLWGCVLIVGMHGLTGDAVSWWKSWLANVIDRVPGATIKGFEEDNTFQQLTGLVAMFFSLGIILSMGLARWWQSTLFYAGGFKEEFCNLRLPKKATLFVVAAGLLCWFSVPQIGIDFIPLLIALLAIQGIATIHGVINDKGGKATLILPLYLLLVFMPGYVGFGLALVGVLDLLLDFRLRFRQKSADQ